MKVDKSEIVTGVININSAMYAIEDIYNGNSVDLDYEYHVLHCEECSNGEDCKELDWLESGGDYLGDYLIGFVECDNDDPDWFYQIEGMYGTKKWKVDTEAEYSAIGREMVLQVVHSQYVAVCKYCSPCYPNQGDLDNIVDEHNPLLTSAYLAQVFCQTKGHSTLAYSLPPDMFDPEYDNYPTDKIFRLDNEN